MLFVYKIVSKSNYGKDRHNKIKEINNKLTKEITSSYPVEITSEENRLHECGIKEINKLIREVYNRSVVISWVAILSTLTVILATIR